MKLDLTKFEAFPVETAVTAESLDLELADSGVNEVAKVTAQLAIQQSGDEYFCQGTIAATVTVDCSRCLKPIQMEIHEDTDFVVCPEGLHDSGPDAPVDAEEYIHYSSNQPLVDLDPVVREAVILGIGMKPVCIEAVEQCRERQQELARQRNLVNEPDRIDPRWEGLKKLKESQSGHK